MSDMSNGLQNLNLLDLMSFHFQVGDKRVNAALATDEEFDTLARSFAPVRGDSSWPPELRLHFILWCRDRGIKVGE